MPWRFTADVETYAERVWDLLTSRPPEHTVVLTIIEAARAGERWSDEPAVLGSYDDGGGVRGAVCMTPPFELLLAAVPDDTVDELAAALRDAGVDVPGVNGDDDVVERFVAAWVEGRNLLATPWMRQRLYALGRLRPPDPAPPGRGRPAREEDLDLAARFVQAFETEAGAHATDPGALVRERMADGRLWVWEDESGGLVSLAARTATAAGVARIAPVYTPPEQRRRGYGGAVTAACTDDALARGAEHVVLFADLANPASNAVYQRIGFRPIADRRIVRFGA